MAQICEVNENTRRGARGLIMPAAHAFGNPSENRLLTQTAAELQRAGLRPRELVADGGFLPASPARRSPTSNPNRSSSQAATNPDPEDPQRRARYRTGIEGRISHLKRGYGLRRSRLKGHERNENLDGLGDPRLRPRHPRHPRPLTHSNRPLHRASP